MYLLFVMEDITISEDSGQPICPKCGEEVDGFTRRGKANYIECPKGHRIGTSHVPPDVMEQYVQVVDPTPKEEGSPTAPPLPPTIPQPRQNVILGDEEVLMNALSQCNVNQRGQDILLRRIRRNGYVSSAEVVNACMVSGSTKNKDEALYIAEEYDMEKMNNEDRKEMLSSLRNSGRGGNGGQQVEQVSQVTQFTDFVKGVKELQEVMPQPFITSGDDGARQEIAELRKQLADNEKAALKQQLDDIKQMVKDSKNATDKTVVAINRGADVVEKVADKFFGSDEYFPGALGYVSGIAETQRKRAQDGLPPLIPNRMKPVGSHNLQKREPPEEVEGEMEDMGLEEMVEAVVETRGPDNGVDLAEDLPVSQKSKR